MASALANPEASSLQVRPMEVGDAAAVAALADLLIGPGYYSEASVAEMVEQATVGDATLAWLAIGSDELVGFRFTLPPGRWPSEREPTGAHPRLSPDRWPGPISAAGYFRSAFVDPRWRGRGVGRQMAMCALEALRRVGAELVVAHSWKESPGDASRGYLTSLGFYPVAEYPDYWAEVDYECVRDGRPCRCTAVEMVRALP